MAEAAVRAWEALFRAQVRVVRLLNAEFPEGEITFNEYDVMFTVIREPDHRVRMRDLTRNVLLSQSSVSRLVDRLVARGYLTKQEDPTDGRSMIVGMTDSGRAAFEPVARQHAASITRALGSALSPSELETLEQICGRLQRSVPDIAPATHRHSPLEG